MAHKDLRPEDVTVIVDTREQLPYDLAPLRVERGTLDTADYTVKGLERFIAYERKSTADLLGCIGKDRDRFERELMRLVAFPVHGVIVEGSWADIRQAFDNGSGEPWRSQLTPKQVMRATEAWDVKYGARFIFAGSRKAAEETLAARLFFAAKYEWERLQAFLPTLRIAT